MRSMVEGPLAREQAPPPASGWSPPPEIRGRKGNCAEKPCYGRAAGSIRHGSLTSFIRMRAATSRPRRKVTVKVYANREGTELYLAAMLDPRVAVSALLTVLAQSSRAPAALARRGDGGDGGQGTGRRPRPSPHGVPRRVPPGPQRRRRAADARWSSAGPDSSHRPSARPAPGWRRRGGHAASVYRQRMKSEPARIVWLFTTISKSARPLPSMSPWTRTLAPSTE